MAAQQPPVPPVVPQRLDSTAAQDSTRRRIDPLVRVAPLGQDTLLLRRPAFFGVLSRINPFRNDPEALGRNLVESLRTGEDVRERMRFEDAITRSLRLHIPLDTARVAVDSVPRPGALVPLRPDSMRLPGRGQIAAELIEGIADLGLNANARLESKFQRSVNDRCTTQQFTAVGTNCSGVFQPAFDFQFDIRSGGVVADRVHVNVDYDSQREFDASNNISVFYQGKSDEMVQRLEFGNVSLSAPASRFLTSGIPSGNYGVQLTGQLGPMRFTSIFADQKGNVSKDNVFTVGERTLQTVDRTIEDIQIETRRFFFTVDPRQFAGYPNIDVLNRQQMQQLAAALPDSVRPFRLYVYRQLIGATNQNPRGPQFSVRGAQNPSRQIYQLLRENVDYYTDPSQLWIALVTPLNQNTERLALAYEVVVDGVTGRNVATGGTPDLEFTEAPQFANLLWEPELQPNNPGYFLREIKSFYRLGGDDIQLGTIGVKLVTGLSGDQEKPADPSRGETYLQVFGLSQATNPNQFDVENRVWPRQNDPNFIAGSSVANQKIIRDYFIAFPSVQPFARAGLAQPAANPANDTLYTYPNEYLYSAQRPQAIYRMIAKYMAEGGAQDGSVSLGAIQIRPNSERVVIDGRLLTSEDYTIDYDIGRITFNRPDTLFMTPRQVSVRYEENPLFTVAPTRIFGFSSLVPLDRGQLTFTAISQQQRSGLTRPPLGFEPNGSFVAGVTANMAWDAPVLSNLVGKLPFGQRSARSGIALQTEFAMSKPQPNSAGQAYIESFEGEAGIPISLFESAWYFSSKPVLGSVLPPLLGSSNPFALNRASTLAYQNNAVDAAGNLRTFTLAQIDPAVRLQGSGLQTPEQVLWMTLYPWRTGGFLVPGSNPLRFLWTVGENSMVGETPTSGRRWRSLRTVLNPSGTDLSRIETIEFFALVYVEDLKVRRNPALLFDFGEISENSVAFAPETLTVTPRPGLPADTTYRGKRLVGYDRFDSERDPFSRAFNAATNDIGLPGDRADTIIVVDNMSEFPVPTLQTKVPLCLMSAGRDVPQLSDSRANCSRGNNRLDEEDIDLDGQLNMRDADVDREQIKRFVVDLSRGKDSWTRRGHCMLQQNEENGIVVTDSLCWVQVRLNWRTPVEVINNPNDRRMRALRMTMISNPLSGEADFPRIALAQLRLVGAPWLKRSDRPLTGLAGDSATTADGYVIASVIGTLDSTDRLHYTPPPGVVEEPENRQADFQNTQIQVNERSLRLQAGAIGLGFRPFDRAEAYFRFAEGNKSFMGYRTLRVWMRGRGNGWGPDGELNGYIKFGRDEHNFYMYRTPVNTGESQTAWLPEVHIDLTRFQLLRSRLENIYLSGSVDSLQCSGVDLELIQRSALPRTQAVRRYAVCEDGYIVYTTDPAITPPNLAGVQELAVGFVRVDSVPRGGNGIAATDTLELWIDDMRLLDVVDDIGFAGDLSLGFNVADLADFRVNLSRRDPNFRQLGEIPSFLSSNGVSIGTTLHLERMLPARLGLVLPFSIDYGGSGAEQLFLNRTDIRAESIDGLRNPRDRRTNYSLSVRRAIPLETGWYAPLVNGLSLNGTWGAASSQSPFQEMKSTNYVTSAAFIVSSDRRENRLPRPIDWLLGILPRRIREIDAIENFRAQTFRWAPTSFRLSSALARNSAATTSYTKAATAIGDTGQVVQNLSHIWRNAAGLEIRPMQALTGRIDAAQLLDLRDYGNTNITVPDSLDRRVAARAERMQLFGADIGLERERTLTTALALQPSFGTWFRPNLSWTTNFSLVKDPNARALLREGDSTGAFRLPNRIGAIQSFNAATMVDVGRYLGTKLSDSSGWRRITRIFGPTDVSWNSSLTSNYDNTVFNPGAGLQFGLGDVSDFRGIGGRLASNAGRVRRFTLNNQFNLPLGISVSTRFEDGSSETWTRRSLDGFQALITSNQQIFPYFNARWSLRPPGMLRGIVSSVQLDAGLEETRQETVVPRESGGIADQIRTMSRRTPYSTRVTWAFLGNLVTNARLTRSVRDEERAGSITSGDTETWSVDMQRTWRLPKKWNTRGNLSTTVSYNQDQSLSAVSSALALTEPPPESILQPSVLANTGRRQFNFTAMTDLSETMTFQLTGGHVITFDRTRNAQISQMIFSVALRVQFFAGEMK